MLYWYLLTAGSWLGIGYMLGSRWKESQVEAMREEVEREVRAQDRRQLMYIDRFNAERLMREADAEFEARHGE